MSGIDTNPCIFEFSEDERLAELARQSERLAGTHETRSVELLEDDARYLVQDAGSTNGTCNANVCEYTCPRHCPRGTACDTFLHTMDAAVTATFPCGVLLH